MLENTNEKLISIIERMEEDSLIKKVIAKETSFEREIENFYKISTWIRVIPRGGIIREYNFIEEESEITKGVPKNLINTIQNFNEENFDLEKLGYASVRDDYKRWHSPSRKCISRIAVYGVLSTIILGGVGCSSGISDGNLITAISGGIIGAGGIVGLITMIYKTPEPKSTNYELREFVKLQDSAKSADFFMNNVYRDYFVKKNIYKRR